MRTQVEKKNVLFNFIDAFVEHTNFTKSISKQDKVYYRYALPMSHFHSQSEEDEQYRLLDHHISIYESQHPDNPFLSQYHYTGYFKDGEENTYQLHIYYDDFDKLTTYPVFELVNPQKNSIIKLSGKLEKKFIIFAEKCIQPVLLQLKSDLSKQLALLENNYQNANIKLTKLDTNDPGTRAELLEHIQTISSTLDNLSKLSTNSLYNKVHHFIRILDKFINKDKPSTCEVEQSSKEGKITTTTTTTTTTTKPPAAVEEKEQPYTIFQSVNEIESRFAHTQTIKCLKEKSTLIAELLPETWEILIHAEQHNIQPQDEQLLKLYQMQSLIWHEAETLMPALIFNNHWDLLNQLSLFHRFIGKKHIELAILTANEKLLHFVLSHSTDNLINQPVTIKSIHYDSPLQACYELTQSEDPKKLACFSLLIQKGASVLIADKKGIPIVHTLIDSTEHPLKKALFDNPEKTIQSRNLYKELSYLLQLAIENQHFEDSETLAIEKSIAYYQSCTKDYLVSTTLTGLSGKNFSQKLNFFYNANTDLHSLSVRLRKESDVSQLYETFEVRYKEFHKKLNPQQRLILKKQIPGTFDKFVEHFKDSSTSVNVLSLPFDLMKKTLKDYINAGIQIISKTDLLLDVQKRLRIPIARQNRSRRQDLALQDHLLEEIKILNRKYNFTSDQSVGLAARLTEIEKSLKEITALLNSFKRLDKEEDNIDENSSDQHNSLI